MMITDTHPRTLSTGQRQRLVTELVTSGYSRAQDVAAELIRRGVVNPRGKHYSMSTIRNDVKEVKATEISEMIGREVYTPPLWKARLTKSYDATQANYKFWDKLRRGKADGFELGSLFCRPLTEIITSFTTGAGFTMTLSDSVTASQARIDYTNQMLARFFSHQHRALSMMNIDLYALGDQYPVVNPDGSMSYISPELVDITTNPLDYRRVDSIAVTTRLDQFTVIDSYTDQNRTITVKNHGVSGSVPPPQAFSNLIGRIPIVHFPNDRGTNEIYGRPIYEALYRLFSRYDDLIEKGIDGVELMGNPMPVVAGLENIQETIDANTTQDDETYTDADGNLQTRQVIRWDKLGIMWLGKGARFDYATPPIGFTGDVRSMLKALFLLMLDYTRVPEAVWGGAINSSLASAEAQMPPFFQYIMGRRIMLEGDGADDDLGFVPQNGMYALADVWLRTRALIDPQIVVGPTTIKWPELDTANWDTMLKWTSYLRGIGLLDNETTLQLFGQIDDPVSVIEKAEDEADEKREKNESEGRDEFGNRLRDAEDTAGEEAEQEEVTDA